MQQAGVQPQRTTTHGAQQYGAQPHMWMICGDLHTAMGTLVTLKNDYGNACDPEELRINMHQAVKQQVNEHGDIMLSQGFSTIHVESNW